MHEQLCAPKLPMSFCTSPAATLRHHAGSAPHLLSLRLPSDSSCHSSHRLVRLLCLLACQGQRSCCCVSGGGGLCRVEGRSRLVERGSAAVGGGRRRSSGSPGIRGSPAQTLLGGCHSSLRLCDAALRLCLPLRLAHVVRVGGLEGGQQRAGSRGQGVVVQGDLGIFSHSLIKNLGPTWALRRSTPPDRVHKLARALGDVAIEALPHLHATCRQCAGATLNGCRRPLGS